MDKYYTPEKEEFCIGFEFEYLSAWQQSDTEWEPLVFNNFKDLTSLNTYFKHAEFRVKYLTKEDIESLGFKVEEEFRNDNLYKYNFLIKEDLDFDEGKIIGSYNIENRYLTIENGAQWPEDHQYYVDELIIKNKSELKRLLKQLGIDDNRSGYAKFLDEPIRNKINDKS